MKKNIFILFCIMPLFILCSCGRKKELPDYVPDGEVTHNQNGGMEVRENPNQPYTLDENFINSYIDEEKMDENISNTINGVETVKQEETVVSNNAQQSYEETQNQYDDVQANAKTDLEKELIQANEKMQSIITQKKSDMNEEK